jgi:NADH-quinone oxidoreductase subunit N
MSGGIATYTAAPVRRNISNRVSALLANESRRSGRSRSAKPAILLSLGGIPFVAGFWAKLYAFWAAAQQGLYWLVLVGAILTVVALS